jgi:hypothetical protein
MSEIRSMTYRQIVDYLSDIEAEFPGGSYLDALMDNEALPWGVDRWLRHEVLPAARKAGRYDLPADLDKICPCTVLGRENAA